MSDNLKEFTCVGCGKKIMITKFASQKTCKCDDCKANDVPINPDIVAEALNTNPPKIRSKSSSEPSGGNTKERPCIQCGNIATVSKFMSDTKVLCDDCKGTSSTNTSGLQQRKITIDPSKIDMSSISPIAEYEVNEIVIANKRLRKVVCPACGHNHMKPIMIADWSIFGLIIDYQCPECFTTILLSEQHVRMMARYTAGRRFDYTGEQMRELGVNGIEHSRMSNAIKILIDKLDENNIKVDEVNAEFPPYKWKNEKPVPTGFNIPYEDVLVYKIDMAINAINDGDSDKAKELLKELLKGDMNETDN